MCHYTWADGLDITLVRSNHSSEPVWRKIATVSWKKPKSSESLKGAIGGEVRRMLQGGNWSGVTMDQNECDFEVRDVDNSAPTRLAWWPGVGKNHVKVFYVKPLERSTFVLSLMCISTSDWPFVPLSAPASCLDSPHSALFFTSFPCGWTQPPVCPQSLLTAEGFNVSYTLGFPVVISLRLPSFLTKDVS